MDVAESMSNIEFVHLVQFGASSLNELDGPGIDLGEADPISHRHRCQVGSNLAKHGKHMLKLSSAAYSESLGHTLWHRDNTSYPTTHVCVIDNN